MEFFVSLLATRLNEASVYMSTWCQSIGATEEPGGNRNRMVNNKAQQKTQYRIKRHRHRVLSAGHQVVS